MNSWVFIFWVITQYYYIYFIGQIVPALTTNSSLSWLLCFFDIFHHCILFCFWTPSDTTRCFYIPCPHLSKSCFAKDPWILFLKTSIRNQDLGGRCPCYCWDDWGVTASKAGFPSDTV